MSTQDTTIASEPAKIQSYVNYWKGFTAFSSTPALLEWSADNRIRLFTINPENSESTGVVFDVPVTEIISASGYLGVMNIRTKKRSYKLIFTTDESSKDVVEGAVSFAINHEDVSGKSIELWKRLFDENGIAHDAIDGKEFTKKAVIGVGILVLILAVVAYFLI